MECVLRGVLVKDGLDLETGQCRTVQSPETNRDYTTVGVCEGK